MDVHTATTIICFIAAICFIIMETSKNFPPIRPFLNCHYQTNSALWCAATALDYLKRDEISLLLKLSRNILLIFHHIAIRIYRTIVINLNVICGKTKLWFENMPHGRYAPGDAKRAYVKLFVCRLSPRKLNNKFNVCAPELVVCVCVCGIVYCFLLVDGEMEIYMCGTHTIPTNLVKVMCWRGRKICTLNLLGVWYYVNSYIYMQHRVTYLGECKFGALRKSTKWHKISECVDICVTYSADGVSWQT